MPSGTLGRLRRLLADTDSRRGRELVTASRAGINRPRWDAWGERLVALTAVGTAIALGHAWFTQYANPEGNGFFSQRISGPIDDPVDVPLDTPPVQPLLGVHYFSDLQQLVAYGKTANPYTIDNPVPNPPLGILQFKALGLFGDQASLWIFLVLAIGLLSFVGWRLMGDLSSPRKLINLTLIVGMTPAMMMAIDRGALSPVAIGMVGIAFLASRSRRWLLAVVVLALAISLKPYLALLLLYPLFRGHWRFVLGTLLGSGIANLAAFALVPGGFTSSLSGFVNASLRYVDSEAAADQATNIKFITLDAVSFPGTILRVITWWKNIDVASMIYDDYNEWVLLPGILFLLAILLVLINRRLPYWVPLTLVLATSTVILPATPLYTLSWVSLAAFYFGSNGGDPFPTRASDSSSVAGIRVVRIAFLCSLGLSVTPVFWMLPGLERGSQDAIGLFAPAALMLSTAVAVIVSVTDLIRYSVGAHERRTRPMEPLQT